MYAHFFLFVFLAVFEYVCSGKILAAIGALACGVVMFVVIKLLRRRQMMTLFRRSWQICRIFWTISLN